MSARWSKPKCASGKAAFRSKGEANRKLEAIALSEQQAAVKSLVVPVRAYQCKCGAWHLTHQPLRNPGQRKPERPSRVRARRPKHSAPRARHLFVAPELLAAPPAHKHEPTSWLPSDPITAARLKHWERLRRENGARNLSNPWPWRQAA